MRFTFVARHRGVWPLAWLCVALDVSHPGFHAWLSRAPSRRAQVDEEISAKVCASFIASARTYGARRRRYALQHRYLAGLPHAGIFALNRYAQAFVSHGIRRLNVKVST